MASKARNVLLTIGIAIVLSLFVGYAVNTFYKEPKYENFCNESIRTTKTFNEPSRDECAARGGEWIEFERPLQPYGQGSGEFLCNRISEDGGRITLSCAETNRTSDGSCDLFTRCSEEYDQARDDHGRVAFIILGLIGLTCVLISGFALKLETVGSGVMAGGILTIIYGTIRYWGSLEDYSRLAVLAIVLATLIWLGYKLVKK